MTDDKKFLGERRRALEESFFQKQDEQLRQKLATKLAVEADKAAFKEICGVTDEAALDALVKVGLTRDTLAALGLVPLVEVAWADGEVDAKEREAILDAAAERGVAKGGTTFQLLESWLAKRPQNQLREAWKSYVAALAAALGTEARAALKGDVIGRARDVAEAAGGFLGISKVSREEEDMLEELSAAFD